MNTPETDAVMMNPMRDGNDLPNLCRSLEVQRDALQSRVKRLEEAGEACHAALGFADDDIREHLQVANYNLNGLLNTGDKIAKPDQPKLIHQSGIDESLKVREIIRSTRLAWRAAKEAKP